MLNSGADKQTPQDILELMRRIARRDRQAFADLFLLVAPKVKGHLMRLGASPSAAEELAQEVMISIWRKAEMFDETKSAPMTWIFVIARNLRIDSLRRERSATTYGSQPPETEDHVTASPSEVVDAHDRERRISSAMGELSSDQRELIRRSFFEDEPHIAIAASLGLPLGTVKSRIRLALKKLRLCLEDLK